MLRMNGANIMSFTLKRVPQLIADTLAAASMVASDVDYFILHQSNRFIMRHLAKKMTASSPRMPLPTKVATAAVQMIADGDLPLAILQSLGRVFAGSRSRR